MNTACSPTRNGDPNRWLAASAVPDIGAGLGPLGEELLEDGLGLGEELRVDEEPGAGLGVLDEELEDGLGLDEELGLGEELGAAHACWAEASKAEKSRAGQELPDDCVCHLS